MDNMKMISAVLQAISGLVLIGLSIYFFIAEETAKAIIFGVVGVIFVALPIRTLWNYFKHKDDKD